MSGVPWCRSRGEEQTIPRNEPLDLNISKMDHKRKVNDKFLCSCGSDYEGHGTPSQLRSRAWSATQASMLPVCMAGFGWPARQPLCHWTSVRWCSRRSQRPSNLMTEQHWPVRQLHLGEESKAQQQQPQYPALRALIKLSSSRSRHVTYKGKSASGGSSSLSTSLMLASPSLRLLTMVEQNNNMFRVP